MCLTVVSHDVLHAFQVGHLAVVSTEDFCSWSKLIREIHAILLNVCRVPTEIINLFMERNIV